MTLIKQQLKNEKGLRVLSKLTVAGKALAHLQYRVVAARDFNCDVPADPITLQPGGFLEFTVSPHSQLETGALFFIDWSSCRSYEDVVAAKRRLAFACYVRVPGYSKRYIARQVGDKVQKAVIESSPVLSTKNKSGGPYFALALDVSMAPQPAALPQV